MGIFEIKIIKREQPKLFVVAKLKRIMKFGKSLSNQIEETLPEWRDKFLSYKDLKKTLKLMEPRAPEDRPNKRSRSDHDTDGMTKEELAFIRLLEDELEKFNSFFVEKEEEYIIRLKELKDQVAKANNSNEEVINRIKKEIVDFHGEMVLLMNYSALNYTGLAKILKKYDKRTGALIRLPFIQKVLAEPFFTTELLNAFVKECEAILDRLFPSNKSWNVEEEGVLKTSTTLKPAATEGSDLLRVPKELSEIEYMESLYMKSTVSALRVLKEIRSGSSTVSVFSLPPLQVSGSEDDSWKKKVGVLEQVAE